MVAYVGRPVTVLDMLRRWESRVGPLVDEASSLEVLEAYVSWLVRQPLGAVFAAAHDEAGHLVPVRVADRLPVERIPIPE